MPVDRINTLENDKLLKYFHVNLTKSICSYIKTLIAPIFMGHIIIPEYAVTGAVITYYLTVLKKH